MKLNIVTQTNEQECGVCALVALHNYFYTEKISKEEALDKSQIDDNGMTIFDFESLGSKLGLESESYEITYSEFKNLKINNFFVLLVSLNGFGNHYVIARKRKKYIEIYDSSSLEMSKISYSKLEKVFLNVVILIKKKPSQAFNKVFSKAKTVLIFDIKFVLINLALSLLILGTSIGIASFLNFIIDLAIAKSSVNNLITICFIFILIYLMNEIFTYVGSLYSSKHVKNYLTLFTSKILSSLQNKHSSFLRKVDKNWIFKIDECVFNISNFCVVEINKFITNIIFLFVCICVIGSIQYYLLIFVLLFLVIELIFFLFAFKKKKEVFLNIVRSENNNALHYKNLLNSLNHEIWASKRNQIIQKIKNNYSNIYKNYSDVILFKNNSSLFKSILKSICEIGSILLMSYLIIKTNKLSIGKLTFAISAFALLKSSTEEFYNYFLSKIEFDIYWQVYKDITAVGNLSGRKPLIKNNIVKTISFQIHNEKINLYYDKTNNIKKSIYEIIKTCSDIYINEKKTLLTQELFNSMIIFDQQESVDTSLLIKNIQNNPTLYSQYLQYFNIDLNEENQPLYSKIIINFLLLLSEKDKMIFVDDILTFIKDKDRVVVKELLNKIKKHNTIFLIGKEEHD